MLPLLRNQQMKHLPQMMPFLLSVVNVIINYNVTQLLTIKIHLIINQIMTNHYLLTIQQQQQQQVLIIKKH